ncbi:MAG: response regulator transcription factor [Nitrospira sp.]|nr:response regulator transcription factor [Nitrospira sp.]
MTITKTTKPKPIRDVIVDDHEVVRIGLRAVLNLTPGITIAGQTASMREAMNLCLRLQPDLALLDIRLPDGSGIDAARTILSNSPSTKVLFLTSFADSHTVTEAILSGAHGYVLKDISSQGLVRAIRTTAAGHTWIDPRLVDHSQPWPLTRHSSAKRIKRPLLSPQEQRLLPLIAEGLTNREIATALNLSEKTVKNYLAKLCTKLQVGRRSQLAAFYAASFKGSGGSLAFSSAQGFVASTDNMTDYTFE